MDLLDPLSSALPSVAPLTPMGAKAMAGGALANPPSSAQPAISSLGRALFEAASGTQSSATGRYQDIEDSDLPEAVKNLLRMIRDLRAKLAQLMRELRGAGLIRRTEAPASGTDEGVQDDRRTYHELTGAGRVVLEAEAARLRRLLGIAGLAGG